MSQVWVQSLVAAIEGDKWPLKAVPWPPLSTLESTSALTNTRTQYNFVYSFVYLTYMGVLLPVCLAPHECPAPAETRKGSQVLCQQELEKSVEPSLSTGNWTRVLWNSTQSALDHWAISATPHNYIFKTLKKQKTKNFIYSFNKMIKQCILKIVHFYIKHTGFCFGCRFLIILPFC